MAEKDRALISTRTRTRDALARAKAAGQVLGGNRGHVIDTARSAEVRKAVPAERKSDVLPEIRDLQAADATTLQAIADGRNAKGITTPRGKAWAPVQVSRVLATVG